MKRNPHFGSSLEEFLVQDTPTYAAFIKLRDEAKLLIDVAKWGAFPDENETKSREFNLQRVIDHAHTLVDMAHELRQVVRDEKK